MTSLTRIPSYRTFEAMYQDASEGDRQVLLAEAHQRLRETWECHLGDSFKQERVLSQLKVQGYGYWRLERLKSSVLLVDHFIDRILGIGAGYPLQISAGVPEEASKIFFQLKIAELQSLPRYLDSLACGNALRLKRRARTLLLADRPSLRLVYNEYGLLSQLQWSSPQKPLGAGSGQKRTFDQIYEKQKDEELREADAVPGEIIT